MLPDVSFIGSKSGYDEQKLYRVDSGAYNWCGLTALVVACAIGASNCRPSSPIIW